MNTDTLNYTIQSCSEALKMVSFKVVPGSYQYIVMIDNIVGRSNFSDIIGIYMYLIMLQLIYYTFK